MLELVSSGVSARKYDEIIEKLGEEAGEKLITLQKIGIPGELMRSFNTTNLIESAFSAPKCSLRRVKKWKLDSDMLDRWISISLLYQEKKFRKVKGVNSLNIFLYKFTKKQVNIDNEKVA